jgi:hypothetical protein
VLIFGDDMRFFNFQGVVSSDVSGDKATFPDTSFRLPGPAHRAAGVVVVLVAVRPDPAHVVGVFAARGAEVPPQGVAAQVEFESKV